MSYSNYPGGFANGVTIRGVPLIQSHPGEVFYVNSSSVLAKAGIGGSNGNPGTYQKPFATIQGAINRCKAGRGDIVLVMPGYTETVSTAAGLDFNVKGVAVIGLGRGSLRPTITMSATTSTIHFDTPDTLVSNVLFVPTAAVVIGINIDKTDGIVHNCEFRGGSGTNQFTDAIEIDGGSANTCDRTKILGCKFSSPTANAASAILLGEVNDDVEISGCYATGDYSDAPIHNPTGSILTQLNCHHNFLSNDQSGGLALKLVSACTGTLRNNFYNTDSAAASSTDPGACQSFECYGNDTDTTASGVVSPAIT